MVIQLDSSINDGLEDLTDDEWSALVNLALAAREGQHYVVAPRALADRLSSHASLGPRERSLYKSLSERYATVAGMVSVVKVKIRVTRCLTHRKQRSGDILEIILPLEFFSTTTSIQPPILLCENLNDCVLLWEMARVFGREIGLGTINPKLELRQGGGQTIATVAEHELARRARLLLVVVDSDRVTPKGGLGQTAKGALEVFSKSDSVLGDLLILNARELENLLPDAFYLDEFANHAIYGNSTAFLTAMIGLGCGEARLYLDVKRGLLLSEILSCDSRPPDHERIWGAVVGCVADGRFPHCQSHRVCADGGVCATPKSCCCILVRSFGGSLLAKGTTAFQHNGRMLWRTLPSCLKAAISEVARPIFEWGCAAPFQPS